MQVIWFGHEGGHEIDLFLRNPWPLPTSGFLAMDFATIPKLKLQVLLPELLGPPMIIIPELKTLPALSGLILELQTSAGNAPLKNAQGADQVILDPAISKDPPVPVVARNLPLDLVPNSMV